MNLGFLQLVFLLYNMIKKDITNFIKQFFIRVDYFKKIIKKKKVLQLMENMISLLMMEQQLLKQKDMMLLQMLKNAVDEILSKLQFFILKKIWSWFKKLYKSFKKS